MDRSSLITWVSGTSRESVESLQMEHNEANHKPGDIILTCKPFVHIITEPMKGQICDLCLRSSSKRSLRCCSDCEQVYFCHSCLSSRGPSIFKTMHILECPFLAQYSSILSNPSKLLLRLYLRLKDPESIPYQSYINPLTHEEITFESLVPRIIYNSKDELIEHIQNFCDKNNLKFNQADTYSDLDDVQKKSLNDIHLGELESVEEIAIIQFLNLFTEFSKCEDLVPLISDDFKIYNLWTMFVRLWSHTMPIGDESITGLFCDDAIAYGLFLEPSVAVYGHSCIPNCSVVFYGPIIQLRAIQPIYSGQNLTLNLVNMSISKKERNKALQSYFISECFCNRCTNRTKEKIDFKSFNLLKNEFVSAYIEEFSTINKNISISSILNFSTNSVSSDDVSKLYKDYLRIHEMGTELYEYYEQIYPFNHPDKSRFLFTYTAVKMNLLLFKLELRSEEHNVSETSTNSEPTRLSSTSDCSEFSGKNSHLDNLTNDIHQWSELLKITVKNIRWTHGVDHRMFREMHIPLSNVWRQALGNKSLTLSQLHSDPTILLRILCSTTRRQSSFFLTQIEQLACQFKHLIGDNIENSSLSKCCSAPRSSNPSNSFSKFLRIVFRTLLVVFAFLFPFIVYYTVYVDEF